MANCVTWMPWSRAAVKWPHSCTAMMAASTPRASNTDPGPSTSNPEPNTPTPAAAARLSSACWFMPLSDEGMNQEGPLLLLLEVLEVLVLLEEDEDEGPSPASCWLLLGGAAAVNCCNCGACSTPRLVFAVFVVAPLTTHNLRKRLDTCCWAAQG